MNTEDRFTLNIIPDEYPISWDEIEDHLTKFAHWHRKGFIGDDIRHYSQEWLLARQAAGDIHLPLFLYEHGGQRVGLSPFHDPWDSGQVGYAWISKEQAIKEFGEEEWREKALEILRADVKELDMYLSGDIWGYRILDNDGEEKDNCFDFYGEEEAWIAGLSSLALIQERQFILDLEGEANDKSPGHRQER